MKITKDNFGIIDNRAIYIFRLTNSNGIQLSVTNYGGIVISLIVPDKYGKFEDVVLGYDTLHEYLSDSYYFGAIIGRYANRIARGKFRLDNKDFSLNINNGKNHLHGGSTGFNKVIWDAEEYNTNDSTGVKLNYLSKDGEEGYPGNLRVQVNYSLNNNNEFQINYNTVSDKSTPVNLSHHSYFNLTGQKSNNILNHSLFIDADSYTPVDNELIPTGEIKTVEMTPFDFRRPTVIGNRINNQNNGFDHNFVLNNKNYDNKAAVLTEPLSGRKMTIYTSEPGMQFYSGNFLSRKITGKNKASYNKHAGLCLETQHFPDSPNKPQFPSTIINPGEQYNSMTIYKFGIVE